MAVMGCALTQVGGKTMFTLIGKTGFVQYVVLHRMWRTSIIFCLIALLIAPFELVMPISFSVLVQYLAFLTVMKQMHVVDSLGTVFP